MADILIDEKVLQCLYGTCKKTHMNITFEELHKKFISTNLINNTERISKYSERLTLKKGMKFTPAPKHVYIVVEGTFYIYQGNDFVGIIPERMPLGLIEILIPMIRFKYECESSVTLLKVAVSDFYRIFYIEHKETKDLLSYFAYLCCFLMSSKRDASNESGFNSIVSMLYRYEYRKEHNPDFNEGVANFIIKRTKISRSYVFEVLSELKRGGYITMAKGKLISINKKIPENY